VLIVQDGPCGRGWASHLRDERQNSSDPGVASVEKFFWGLVPESRLSSRYCKNASVSPTSVEGDGLGAASAELRLRVLCSLPPTHQRYLFDEMRELCRLYLRNRRVAATELTPEELVSEIWQKLIGTVSLGPMNEAPESLPVASREWSIDHHAPERDERIVWLIEEIGGRDALAHRHEDILRQRFGRSTPRRGRRIVQPEIEDGPSGMGSESEEGSALKDADTRRVWRGLLITAGLEFQPDDDVQMLLRSMADDPDILDASSGEQWPIKEIVALLNLRFPPPSWTERRVDNAKRRLLNWISRLMRKNGLDSVDLEGVFARVARQHERNEPGPFTETQRIKLSS
jgi:hypothetical protein